MFLKYYSMSQIKSKVWKYILKRKKIVKKEKKKKKKKSVVFVSIYLQDHQKRLFLGW